jgi:hypothetical protein
MNFRREATRDSGVEGETWVDREVAGCGFSRPLKKTADVAERI